MIEKQYLALRDSGIILLSGIIEKKEINEAASSLLYLNNLKKRDFESARIILNSPGGSCCDAFMLIDLINYCSFDVFITGLGLCASMGIMLLCGGAKGHRVITHNTELLSHQFSVIQEGKYHELKAAQKRDDQTHNRLVNHYVKNTKLDKKSVEKILLPESDVWLTPKEAVKYGIADKIL